MKLAFIIIRAKPLSNLYHPMVYRASDFLTRLITGVEQMVRHQCAFFLKKKT